MSTTTTITGVHISGASIDPTEPWVIPVTEPTTGTTLYNLAGGGAEDARRALNAALRTFADFAVTPAAQRANMLRAIAADLREGSTREQIAVLISKETGKRVSESRAEVDLSARFFDWFAALIDTRHNKTWTVIPGIDHTVTQRPLGVVAVLTPWNFPVSIPARKIAPALAAGCTVLFKPSEVAPASALRLAEIVEAHVPAGVINTVLGEPASVVEPWLAHPAVRGLTFTGSTRVGKLLAAQTAPHFIRCVFELGGNAPFVMLDDADVDRAVELLMIAKYRNNGQSCIAANQAWVPDPLVDEFVEAFAAATNNLVLGDPLNDETTLGPLALPSDPNRITSLIDNAESAGTKIIRSTVRVPATGHFAGPAICVNPPAENSIVSDEIFGPVISVRGYHDLNQVVTATRDTRYGLGGYIIGNPTRARILADALDVAIVGVNTATPNTPQVPFGGLKYSGIGWEGGEVGLDAFVTQQTVATSAR